MSKFSMLALTGIVIALSIMGAVPVYAADCPQPGDMISVMIDVKPGTFPNAVNLKSKGLVPVALLGSDTFDVYNVDPGTVGLHPMGRCEQMAAPVRYAFEDVNKDGYTDTVFHFKIQETGLQAGDTEACLHGNLTGGQHFCGHDSVVILGADGAAP